MRNKIHHPPTRAERESIAQFFCFIAQKNIAQYRIAQYAGLHMPKKVSQIELILEIVGRFPGGASVEEILLGLNPPPPRRTLQYRLASLVKSGCLVAEGRTKGRRFYLPADERTVTSDQLPLSTIAHSINLTVSRPIQERPYVSYSREFLDRYRPRQVTTFQRH